MGFGRGERFDEVELGWVAVKRKALQGFYG